MRLIVKLWAVLVMVVMLGAPVAEAFHCEDEDPSCCAADCSCVCHVEAASVSSAQTGFLANPGTGCEPAMSSLFIGTLLPADIFRPPISG